VLAYEVKNESDGIEEIKKLWNEGYSWPSLYKNNEKIAYVIYPCEVVMVNG
jgi:hypothetical protein